jgi:peroxin-5
MVYIDRDLPALMSLAVSCTNDSYRVQALRVLKNWLARNPRYHDHPLLSAPEFAQGAPRSPNWIAMAFLAPAGALFKLTPAHHPADIDTLDDESELHERVTEIYLEAARMSPHDPDPDVQIALGLLFNISQVRLRRFVLSALPRSIDMLVTHQSHQSLYPSPVNLLRPRPPH